MKIRAHQPGSLPLDTPDSVPNPHYTPAPPQPAEPRPERQPDKTPVKTPEKVPA